MMDTPPLCRVRMICIKTSVSFSVKAEVGSSKIRTFAFCLTARRISTIC